MFHFKIASFLRSFLYCYLFSLEQTLCTVYYISQSQATSQGSFAHWDSLMKPIFIMRSPSQFCHVSEDHTLTKGSSLCQVAALFFCPASGWCFLRYVGRIITKHSCPSLLPVSVDQVDVSYCIPDAFSFQSAGQTRVQPCYPGCAESPDFIWHAE